MGAAEAHQQTRRTTHTHTRARLSSISMQFYAHSHSNTRPQSTHREWAIKISQSRGKNKLRRRMVIRNETRRNEWRKMCTTHTHTTGKPKISCVCSIHIVYGLALITITQVHACCRKVQSLVQLEADFGATKIINRIAESVWPVVESVHSACMSGVQDNLLTNRSVPCSNPLIVIKFYKHFFNFNWYFRRLQMHQIHTHIPSMLNTS